MKVTQINRFGRLVLVSVLSGAIATMSIEVQAEEPLYPPPPVPLGPAPGEDGIRPAGIWGACLIIAAVVGIGIGGCVVAKKCKKVIRPRTFDDIEDDSSTNRVQQSPLFKAAGSPAPVFVTGPVDSCHCADSAEFAAASAGQEEPQLEIITQTSFTESGNSQVVVTRVRPARFLTEAEDDAERAAYGWPDAGLTPAFYIGSNAVSMAESPVRIYSGNIVALDGPGYESLPRTVVRIQASSSLDEGAWWQTVSTHVIPTGMKWRTVVPQAAPGTTQMFYRAVAETSPW